MAKLTNQQKEFLKKHNIEERTIFDATGIRHKDYGEIMKKLGLFFAIGVTPCQKKGHTLRSRKGKCIQCNPADIAFIQRSGKNAYIYVAGSLKNKVLKVGFTKDINDRFYNLNQDNYAGINDWKILYKGKFDNALKFENFIHNKLLNFQYKIEYKHYGKTIVANEIFKCNFSRIKKIIDLNKKDFGNVEDEFILKEKIEKYNFFNENKKSVEKSKNIEKEVKKISINEDINKTGFNFSNFLFSTEGVITRIQYLLGLTFIYYSFSFLGDIAYLLKFLEINNKYIAIITVSFTFIIPVLTLLYIYIILNIKRLKDINILK